MGREKTQKTEQNSPATNGTEKDQKLTIRQQIFGNWTGKLPVNLLHELVQREKWEKPNYHFIEKQKGIQCKVTLGKFVKKSGKIEQITFTSKEFFENQQLAKHATATYALHRLCSNKSLHTLLPPSQRDLWQKYEQWKQEKDPDVALLEYSSDPFLVKEQALTQVEKKPDEPWLDYPSIHIPKQQREALENLIRSNTEHAIVQDNQDLNIDRVKEILLRKGFRASHVEEALQYQSGIQASMDWLCIHVPEDDLPKNMRLQDKKSIIVSNHTAETLSRQFIIDRICRPGFPRSLCESHLNKCNNQEYWAIISLCMELAGLEYSQDTNTNVNAIEEILLEEKEVVESIYGEMVTMTNQEEGFSFIISLEVTGKVEIYIPKNSNYPHLIPGIVLGDHILPAYIRLSITRMVTQSCLPYIGAPMIFNIISAIEEIAPGVIHSPPPLVSLYAPASGIEFKEIKIKPGKQSRSNVRSKSNTLIEEENISLFSEYVSRKETAAYQKMLKIRTKLPSYSFKERIIDLLKDNSALIICGETGCGKSTQLGQFILEHFLESKLGGTCNIICTQPRRISAISLAERVSAERVDQVGKETGYSIRGESKQSSRTKLLFCTTGVLLRMIHHDTELKHISHVIIDEVHERGVESDFLLVLLRDLLKRRSDLRVVLMSATIEASTVSKYFSCPVVEIPGFTHPVEDLYLETILDQLDYVPKNLISKTKKKTPEEELDDELEEIALGNVSMKRLVQTERDTGFRIDYELVARIVADICSKDEPGAILIFLPGIMEIKRCIEQIKDVNSSILSQFEVFPLHSNLTSQEQSQVFRKMLPGKRKIVVSTNIAETSVTIDDVVFVIDTGRVKGMLQ
jgi:ATP-dependent RNA helicase DHX57